MTYQGYLASQGLPSNSNPLTLPPPVNTYVPAPTPIVNITPVVVAQPVATPVTPSINSITTPTSIIPTPITPLNPIQQAAYDTTVNNSTFVPATVTPTGNTIVDIVPVTVPTTTNNGVTTVNTSSGDANVGNFIQNAAASAAINASNVSTPVLNNNASVLNNSPVNPALSGGSNVMVYTPPDTSLTAGNPNFDANGNYSVAVNTSTVPIGANGTPDFTQVNNTPSVLSTAPPVTFTTTVPNSDYYKIGDVYVAANDWDNASDASKFNMLQAQGQILAGSLFIPALTQAEIDSLGADGKGLTPTSWGYYTPEQIQAQQTSLNAQGSKFWTQYQANAQIITQNAANQTAYNNFISSIKQYQAPNGGYYVDKIVADPNISANDVKLYFGEAGLGALNAQNVAGNSFWTSRMSPVTVPVVYPTANQAVTGSSFLTTLSNPTGLATGSADAQRIISANNQPTLNAATPQGFWQKIGNWFNNPSENTSARLAMEGAGAVNLAASGGNTNTGIGQWQTYDPSNPNNTPLVNNVIGSTNPNYSTDINNIVGSVSDTAIPRGISAVSNVPIFGSLAVAGYQTANTNLTPTQEFKPFITSEAIQGATLVTVPLATSFVTGTVAGTAAEAGVTSQFQLLPDIPSWSDVKGGIKGTISGIGNTLNDYEGGNLTTSEANAGVGFDNTVNSAVNPIKTGVNTWLDSGTGQIGDLGVSEGYTGVNTGGLNMTKGSFTPVGGNAYMNYEPTSGMPNSVSSIYETGRPLNTLQFGETTPNSGLKFGAQQPTIDAFRHEWSVPTKGEALSHAPLMPPLNPLVPSGIEGQWTDVTNNVIGETNNVAIPSYNPMQLLPVSGTIGDVSQSITSANTLGETSSVIPSFNSTNLVGTSAIIGTVNNRAVQTPDRNNVITESGISSSISNLTNNTLPIFNPQKYDMTINNQQNTNQLQNYSAMQISNPDLLNINEPTSNNIPMNQVIGETSVTNPTISSVTPAVATINAVVPTDMTTTSPTNTTTNTQVTQPQQIQNIQQIQQLQTNPLSPYDNTPNTNNEQYWKPIPPIVLPKGGGSGSGGGGGGAGGSDAPLDLEAKYRIKPELTLNLPNPLENKRYTKVLTKEEVTPAAYIRRFRGNRSLGSVL